MLSQETDRGVWLALLVIALVGALGVRSMYPPEVVPATAALTEYSAERALSMLRRLLGDETPHPVGSAANRAVRDRLVDMLEELGLEPQVQRTIGCSSRRALCARVENVIAQIGDGSDNYVMLMAHYDSVPHAPGAADDGSGVVALLETARALIAEGDGRNPVLLVFTDSEEVGLLGAEAFFAEHPAAAGVKAVINVEGSGSGGPSLLLRTTRDGGRLLRTFQDFAPTPVALSVAQEIFTLMPNDTDFSVAERAGIPAIDFSFAFEFNHYHTPLDTIANLDPATLQHHGDNVLPLVRELRDMSLAEVAPTYSYLTVQQSLWLTWPTNWTLWLAISAIVLLLIAAIGAKAAGGLLQTLAGLGLATGALALAALACLGGLWLVDQVAGARVNFPANSWPWRFIVAGGCLLGVSLIGWWPSARVRFWPLFIGSWMLLGILTLTVSVLAPLAANLTLIAVLSAAVLAVVGTFGSGRDKKAVQAGIAIVSLAVLAYPMISLGHANEETQGWQLAPAIYGGLALLMIALLPLRPGRTFFAIAVAVMVAGLGWSSVTDLYSAQRPQHISLNYVLDRDEERAYWAALSSNPLPKRMRRAGGGAIEVQALPWSDRLVPSFDAPLVEFAASELIVDRQAQVVNLQYRRRAAEDFVLLVIAEDAGLTGISIEGRSVPVTAWDGFVTVAVFAPGDGVIRFELRFDHEAPVNAWLVDGGNRLPLPNHKLILARGELAVPQHRGDQRLAYRRVTF